MEIATMCLRGLEAARWARLRRNGVAEPVTRGLVKNIGGMRLPDEPGFPLVVRHHLGSYDKWITF